MPVPPTSLRLRLDQILVLDFLAMLPEGTVFTGAGIDLETFYSPDSALRYETFDEGTKGRFYAASTGTFPMADPENPDAPLGTISLYVDGGEPYVIPILGAIDAAAAPADLRGGAGRDRLLYDAGVGADPATVLVDTSGGSDRAEVIGAAAIMLGRSGDDTLIGWDMHDGLYGGGGGDRLEGRGGDDRMLGLGGNDALFGGDGSDVLYGGEGDDLLDGGDGDDRLVADGGFDTLRGGLGHDTLDANEHNMRGRLMASDRPAYLGFGGEGDDALYGGSGASTLHGGAGQDFIGAERMDGAALYGGDGNDQIYAGVANAEDETLPMPPAVAASSIFGGSGDDYVVIWGGDSFVSGGAGNDTLFASGEISAGDGDDLVYVQYVAQATGTLIYGGNGRDSLDGSDGGDTLHGGADGDRITGNQGDDVLFGGTGNDTLNGGAGLDVLSGGDGDDSLTASDGDSPHDPLTGDTLVGGAGMDQLWGDRGGHAYYGGSGNDLIRVTMGHEGEATSAVDGGLGDDLIFAAGATQATGGAGRDVFAVDRSTVDLPFATMTIMDFVRGEDKLDANVYGTNVNGMMKNFDGNGMADLTDFPTGSLVWESTGDDQITVYLDGDGDAGVDAILVVNGLSNLEYGDLMTVDA